MTAPAVRAGEWPPPVEAFRRYSRIVCLLFGICGGLLTATMLAAWAATGRRPEWFLLVLPLAYAAIGALYGVAAFPRRGRRWRRLALAAQILGPTNAITLIPSLRFLWRLRKPDVRDWMFGEDASEDVPPRRA